MIHGVDHSVDVSNIKTVTAANESAYNPTIEELDVKPPATKSTGCTAGRSCPVFDNPTTHSY